MTNEKIITLIGNKQAKKGYQFIHLGHLKECQDCKLFQICVKNLKVNRMYEVIEVRPKKHDCIIHEDGVTVVEVKELDIIASIPSNIAFEGATITFQSIDCDDYECEFYNKCKVKIKTGQKCRINEIITPKTIECKKKNLHLKIVKLKIL
ncbi:MAG: UPF0179 family protein [Candidatus Helarchaeota archaeon]